MFRENKGDHGDNILELFILDKVKQGTMHTSIQSQTGPQTIYTEYNMG